jgi:hypothetical protein
MGRFGAWVRWVYWSMGLLRYSAFTLGGFSGFTLERGCFVTTPERGNDGVVLVRLPLLT